MDEDLDYPAKLEQSAETKSETSSVSIILSVMPVSLLLITL